MSGAPLPGPPQPNTTMTLLNLNTGDYFTDDDCALITYALTTLAIAVGILARRL